jgi:hypothetical protein
MRFTSFVLLTCLLPFAGCLGLPDDAVGLGDTVIVAVVIRDADTGAVLLYGLTGRATDDGNFSNPASLRALLEDHLGAPLPPAISDFIAQHAETEEGPAQPVPEAALVALLEDNGLLDRVGYDLRFTVASGASGLGHEFEREFVGATVDEPMQFGADALTLDVVVRRERVFGPVPLVGEISRTQFEAAFGPAVEGLEFTPPQSFYLYRLETVTDTSVVYRVLPEDGQENAVPVVGATLVTTVLNADEMLQTLEPIVGARFTIAPPDPFNPQTPLDLEPGAYRVVGAEEDELVFRFRATQFDTVIGHPLDVHATVTALTRGPDTSAQPVVMDDNTTHYGIRDSPLVNGVPASTPDYGAHEE